MLSVPYLAYGAHCTICVYPLSTGIFVFFHFFHFPAPLRPEMWYTFGMKRFIATLFAVSLLCRSDAATVDSLFGIRLGVPYAGDLESLTKAYNATNINGGCESRDSACILRNFMPKKKFLAFDSYHFGLSPKSRVCFEVGATAECKRDEESKLIWDSMEAMSEKFGTTEYWRERVFHFGGGRILVHSWSHAATEDRVIEISSVKSGFDDGVLVSISVFDNTAFRLCMDEISAMRENSDKKRRIKEAADAL